MKVLISGGGTGGHVFPAIAIADAIKRQHGEVAFQFVGAKGKIEMEKVPKAGYPIKGLWISGFHRKNMMRNLAFPFKLISSLWKAFWIVRGFKPDVAVGVGGYASGPTLQIANWLGVPTLIQEQNSHPGVTNRLLASKVDKICVVYEGMDKFFPKEKIVLTGNPVRQDIIDLKGTRAEACAHFGLDPNKKILFLFGGSLGAQSMNEAVAASVELLKNKPDVQLYWQAGKLYIERFKDSEVAQLPNVKITAFIDRMDLAYVMADVIISRAGGSISEMCIVGKPAVLVPSPNVAEDHQTANVQSLVAKEAAILVKDKDAKTEMLKAAMDLLEDEVTYAKLSRNIKQMEKPDAADRIAKEVLALVK